MLQALLSKISGREAAERAAKEDRYVALILLKKDDEKTVTELRQLMADLGKTSGDLARDMKVLETAQQLYATTEAGSNLGDKAQKAAAAVVEFNNESEQIARDREKRNMALVNESSNLNHARMLGQRSERSFADLVSANPVLLRTIKAPRFQD